MLSPENTRKAIVEKIQKRHEITCEITRMRYESWQERDDLHDAFRAALEEMRKEAEMISPPRVSRLFQDVLTTRRLYVRLRRAYRAGEFPGALLTGFGSEALAVGIAHAAEPYDLIAQTHRDYGVFIVRGTPLVKIVGSHYLTSASPTEGRDAGGHFGDLERNIIGFLISDMAFSAVLTNGATWYANLKRSLGNAASNVSERICGLAFVGDGAASHGCTHEGMGFAKAGGAQPVLFVIHDNGIALSTGPKEQHGGINLENRAIGYEMPFLTVDGDDVLETYLGARYLLHFVRATGHPALLHARTHRRTGHNEIGTGKEGSKALDSEEQEALKDNERNPLRRAAKHCVTFGIFETADVDEKEQPLDATYRAFQDEADQNIEEACLEAKNAPMPKELPPALVDPSCAIVSRFADEHKPQGESRRMNMAKAIGEALEVEMKANPEIHIFGEDVGWPEGGIYGITRDLIQNEALRSRIHNVPLAENALAGFAAGAGLLGGRTVIEFQYGNFSLAAASIMFTFIGTRAFMDKKGLRMVMRFPYGGADVFSNHYHQSTAIEAMLIKTHGIKVVVPATPEDAKGLMLSALQDEDCVAFMEELSAYLAPLDDVPVGRYGTPFTPIVRRDGNDLTIVTWGPEMVKRALKAAGQLESEKKIKAEVIDLRVLWPWDEQFILSHVEKSHRLMILHEDSKTGGLGVTIAATIAEKTKGICSLWAPISIVASKDVPWPVAPALEQLRLPSVEDVLREAERLMGGF